MPHSDTILKSDALLKLPTLVLKPSE